jgi:L-alanine-DL-glutamate epimerase-like enolase superfamily enzyme
MNVTRVERVESDEPIELPEPWLPAWNEPDGEPQTEFPWAVVRVHTDAGVTGVGPATGDLASADVDLVDADATRPGEFWTRNLSGKRAGNATGLAGVEIALWDAYGKTVGEPVHRLLGGGRDRVPAYAATSRTLPPENSSSRYWTSRRWVPGRETPPAPARRRGRPRGGSSRPRRRRRRLRPIRRREPEQRLRRVRVLVAQHRTARRAGARRPRRLLPRGTAAAPRRRRARGTPDRHRRPYRRRRARRHRPRVRPRPRAGRVRRPPA